MGTGFFCKIPYNERMISVLITNYHIIDDNFFEKNTQIKLYINDKRILLNIDKNSKLYSSPINKYDIIIIKIKEEYEINNYLEIDPNIFNNNSELSYKDEPIYILHYPYLENCKVSEGIGLEKINNYDIKHFCNTKHGSSGGPILNRFTNKVIGIHKGTIVKVNNNFNIGTFLKNPLNELNKKEEEIEQKGILFFKNYQHIYHNKRQSENILAYEFMKYNKISKKHIKILLLGLDNAGKSTILYYLDHDANAYRNGYPTGGTVNISNFTLGDTNIEFYDYGGQSSLRHDWKYYCPNPDFLIFVIDASDEWRIEEVKDYFQSILNEEKLKKIPVLTFGNKADLPNCLCPDELIEKLNMENIKDRDWSVYECSALKGTGVKDGIQWIFEKLSDEY